MIHERRYRQEVTYLGYNISRQFFFVPISVFLQLALLCLEYLISEPQNVGYVTLHKR